MCSNDFDFVIINENCGFVDTPPFVIDASHQCHHQTHNIKEYTEKEQALRLTEKDNPIIIDKHLVDVIIATAIAILILVCIS